MNIEEYIEKIVRDGKIEDMQEMSDILEDTLDIIKDYDQKCYEEYTMRLYIMANGKHLDKSMAKNIVNKMRPYGEKFTLEQSREVQNRYGLNDIKDIDFYVVINSAYNDYKDIFGEDIDGYVKFTVDFIKDEDAKEGKVFKYFTQIVED